MSGQNYPELNQILAKWPQNAVVTSNWLEKHGIYRQLVQKYVQGGWIQRIAAGAFRKPGDHIDWRGALNALQEQLELPIHLGGASWISFKGYSQHISTTANEPPLNLYGKPGISLPRWFTKGPWAKNCSYTKQVLFHGASDLGLTSWTTESGMTLKASSLERAFLEMINRLAKLDFEQLYEVCERLSGLRPLLLQELLENCTSFQTKRVFLFIADRCSHPWFKKLNLEKIELGRGKRTVFKGGVFNSKYLITVPTQYRDQT